MTRKLYVFLLAATVGLAAAPLSAQKAEKSQAKEQKYDVAFVFEDTTYTGTMTLKVAGTDVTGTMAITAPVSVTADVAGTLKKDELALDYPFSMAGDQPCNGQVVVTAKMTADRASASGTARASGCGDQPLDGTVTLKKAVPTKLP